MSFNQTQIVFNTFSQVSWKLTRHLLHAATTESKNSHIIKLYFFLIIIMNYEPDIIHPRKQGWFWGGAVPL